MAGHRRLLPEPDKDFYMSDDTNRRLLMDRNGYILDWLTAEPVAQAADFKESEEKRINALISVLSRDDRHGNVLRFKPRKK